VETLGLWKKSLYIRESSMIHVKNGEKKILRDALVGIAALPSVFADQWSSLIKQRRYREVGFFTYTHSTDLIISRVSHIIDMLRAIPILFHVLIYYISGSTVFSGTYSP
jgi:hypothetical protein